MINRPENHNFPPAAWSIILVLVAVVFYLIGERHERQQAKTPTGKAPTFANGTAVLHRNGNKDLLLGEHTISDIAEHAGKSVVNLEVEGDFSLPMNPDYNLDPGSPPKRWHIAKTGSASGVILRSDGYILTSNHVVRIANKIKVSTSDKRTFTGTVVGRDSYSDLAVIKIDAKDLIPAKFGKSEDVRPGDWAIAIGSPLRLDHSVSMGIVSAIGRNLENPTARVEMIQTDAAINPGSSGGPLLNIQGEVIGINTAVRNDGQNIGFAIPIATASDVAASLLSRGMVARGFLGVHMHEMDVELARILGVKPADGVLIMAVQSDGPCKSVLKVGDIIQSIDTKKVRVPGDIRRVVQAKSPGETVQLSFLHKGAAQSATVKLAEFRD